MANHKIALVTDSTCDIPQDLLAQYDIDVVPSFVIWGDDKLRDRIDIQPEAFYRRLAVDPVHPTTAHPSPGDFCQAYRRAIERGAQEIVTITVSSAMSGTFSSACQAGKMVDVPVHVVDAKGPSMSLGWQVLAAARVREAGVEAMLAVADNARRSMVQFVCPDTLEYLHRGGRIGGAAKWIGTLLKVKPLVTINHETGLVEAGTRAHTRRKALDILYREFFKRLETGRTMRIAVLHGGAPEDAEAMAGRIRREFSPAELLVNITGPVLGIHTGPRAIALCGYTEAPAGS